MKKLLFALTALLLVGLLCLSMTACDLNLSGLLHSDETETSDTEDTASLADAVTDAATPDGEAVVYGPEDYPDYSAYVTLGQYKGLTLTPVDTSVSDEQVEEQIAQMLDDYTTTAEVTDRAARLGDTANIDYTGYKDGVAFDGGHDTGFPLELGSNRFIPGFEDAIVGHEVGETFTIDVTFPETYDNEELAGQPVQFEIVLNGLSEPVVPTYDDAFIASVSSYQTTAEFEDALKVEIAAQNEQNRMGTMINEAWPMVCENCEITDYPEDELNDMVAELLENYTGYATEMGYESLEDFLTGYYETTLEDFTAEAETYAKSSLSESMIIYEIARAENLDITAEEYAEGAAEYAAMYGFTTAAELEEYYGEDLIKESLLWDEVLEFVVNNSAESAA